ncbi:hypothetical protein NA57DRAFT_70604 [Rhizodiscina lignyota]|uniref:Uncharacterized protein n=1 Tax=Rhizodiscina lignyota TaxID=1504668 RepID=A0A9P4MEF0_9PEZI|nr:hypothetical protein NA57DRAFT_70604 [Rhizodiscina lignyota]
MEHKNDFLDSDSPTSPDDSAFSEYEETPTRQRKGKNVAAPRSTQGRITHQSGTRINTQQFNTFDRTPRPKQAEKEEEIVDLMDSDTGTSARGSPARLTYSNAPEVPSTTQGSSHVHVPIPSFHLGYVSSRLLPVFSASRSVSPLELPPPLFAPPVTSPFRSSRRGHTERPGRTQIDHDVFEGLPIRQWRQAEATIAPPPTAQPIKNKNEWPEPPMPRDWQLLPDVSQQLLRAARSGKLYKPPTPTNEDDDKGEDDDGESANKETQKGFAIKKWSQVPRHMEGPEREYLAKRRKGLGSVYSVWSGHQGPLAQTGAMRETKVKKVDAEGNVNIWKVLVPEGQSVEGEIVEETAEAVPSAPAAAPGTVIEGVGVVNADGVVVASSEIIQPTPPRRKPPPPRRKPKKGPGRGHKKKVAFEPGAEGASDTQNGDTQTSLAVPTTAAEGATPAEGDTPMPDAEEEESGEEGEEGEEGDEDEDREEGELSPTPDDAAAPAKPTTGADVTSAPAPAVAQTVEEGAPAAEEVAAADAGAAGRDASSSPDEPLATSGHSRSGSLTQPAVDLLGSLEKRLEEEEKKAEEEL